MHYVERKRFKKKKTIKQSQHVENFLKEYARKNNCWFTTSEKRSKDGAGSSYLHIDGKTLRVSNHKSKKGNFKYEVIFDGDTKFPKLLNMIKQEIERLKNHKEEENYKLTVTW